MDYILVRVECFQRAHYVAIVIGIIFSFWAFCSYKIANDAPAFNKGSRQKEKQAGVELCQAQETLGLAKLALHCKKLWLSSI
jgi:hypothetical protein